LTGACSTDPKRELPVAQSVEALDFSPGQPLHASKVSQVGSFGTSVAVSDDTALVGAIEGDFEGAVYVCSRGDTGWVVGQRLVAADAHSNAYFGEAVALAGDTALVGASEDSRAGGEYEGAAYIFDRSGDNFTQSQKLKASDPTNDVFFGKAVALQSDTALVGSNAGAYVFVRDGSAWKEQQKLTVEGMEAEFGAALGLDADTALVGSDGAAYVFVRQGETFTLQQKLSPDDGDNQYFGMAVAVAGDFALVGAYLDATNNLDHAGSAYLFARTGTNFTQVQKLAAPRGHGDWFGFAVALTPDRALVGADYESGGGAAYVFLRGESDWTQEQKFSGTDKSSDDYFGSAVAIDGRDAIVGAWGTRVGGVGQAGLAYVYSLAPATGSAGAPSTDPGTNPGDGAVAGAPGDAGNVPAVAPADTGDTTDLDAGNAAGGQAPENTEPGAGGHSGADGASTCDGPDAGCRTKQTETITDGGWGFSCSIAAARGRANSSAWLSLFALLAASPVFRSSRRRARS
jgi:hypothetical protein